MGLEDAYEYGQTPIDVEELNGLRLSSITTKAQLNEAEQLTIEDTIKWSIGKRWTAEEMITSIFLLRLHKRMFGSIWSWAGSFRKTEKNIGVDSHTIRQALLLLLQDVRFWVENDTYSEDEIAIRFSHRLVAIHCFPNGNGRHSRLVADLVVANLFEGEVFSWGRFDKADSLTKRKRYISALRKADAGSIEDLLRFARS